MTSAMLPPAPSGGPVDDTAVDDRELLRAQSPGGFWRDVFKRLRRNPTAWIGAAIVVRLRVRRRLRAVARARIPETALPGREVHHPDPHPRAGRAPAVPARARPLRRRRAVQAHLGRARIPRDRRRLDRARPRSAACSSGSWPGRSAAGSTTSSCASSTSCSPCRTCCSRCRSPRSSVSRQYAVMIAIGASQVPIFARLLRSSMLQQSSADYVLVGADAGPRPRHHHDEPRAAERHRPGHRAGHADARDRRHRRGGAVVPRPRRRAARDRRVGPHAHLRAGRARDRARGSRSCPASASPSPRSASRCSARRCARRWTRAPARADRSSSRIGPASGTRRAAPILGRRTDSRAGRALSPRCRVRCPGSRRAARACTGRAGW